MTSTPDDRYPEGFYLVETRDHEFRPVASGDHERVNFTVKIIYGPTPAATKALAGKELRESYALRPESLSFISRLFCACGLEAPTSVGQAKEQISQNQLKGRQHPVKLRYQGGYTVLEAFEHVIELVRTFKFEAGGGMQADPNRPGKVHWPHCIHIKLDRQRARDLVMQLLTRLMDDANFDFTYSTMGELVEMDEASCETWTPPRRDEESNWSWGVQKGPYR